MAKTRKTRRKAKPKPRAAARKMRSRTLAAKVRRKRPKRKRKDLADQVTSAVQIVSDAWQETSRMRRRMGSRGGLSEG